MAQKIIMTDKNGKRIVGELHNLVGEMEEDKAWFHFKTSLGYRYSISKKDYPKVEIEK